MNTAEMPQVAPTQDERNAALIAHALTFVEGGVVGPLLFYLFRKPIMEQAFKAPDSEFVAFHALQSFYFGLLIGPAFIATIFFGFLFFPLWLLALVMLPLYLIYEVVGCMKAHAGEWFMLPVVGRFAAMSHPPPGAALR
jgi:uncharacterized membrane protein